MVKNSEDKGITLIALVVTIVILLILARCKCRYDYRRKWSVK
jgi:Tfp pilus assembly protein PilE